MQVPTEKLRSAQRLLKAITWVVLGAFVNTSLTPLAIATEAPAKQTTAPKLPTEDERLAKVLQQTEETLNTFERKLGQKQSTSAEEANLQDLRAQIEPLDQAARRDFANIEKNIKAKGLPQEILDRHNKAVKAYEANIETFRANLKGLEGAKTETDKKSALAKTLKHLRDNKPKQARAPIDPTKLPQRVLKPNRNNKPKTTEQEFQAGGFYSNPTVKLAAAGNFTFDKLPGANDPAYLGETSEVVLTERIRAKAAELEHDPVKIVNWIYANTEWQPTWGAIENADVALATQRGNAFDLASLLIALLRASGFPARYVHGTVDVPADRFMNWLGGFTDPIGAWDLASAGGLPITGVTSGGTVKTFRTEHVWVEAALDFYPSHGAINKSADSWVALDPSFKQYVAERGYDMHSMLAFDGEQYLKNYFADPRDKTPYQYYSELVTNHINTTNPDWTLLGLYGHERISPLKEILGGNFPRFPASLPYKVVVRGYDAARIPDSLKQSITIDIATDPQYGFDTEYSVTLPQLGADRLTLSYIPESAADDAVVEDYGSLFASPAYLVRVKPVLKRNGAVVAVGPGTTLGEKQQLVLNLLAPSVQNAPIEKKVTAGSYNAIVIQGQKSSITQPSANMQKLMASAEANEVSPVDMDQLLGQLLHNIGVGWFFNWVYERDFYATTMHVAYVAHPSQAFVTADLTPRYFFGIVRSVTPGIFNIDAHRDTLAIAAFNGETKRQKDFMIAAGMTGSAWEHLIHEGFFNTQAASAVKLLKLATQQGIPVFYINQANASQLVPQLQIPGDDLADIINALNAGANVTISKTPVQLGNYVGTGYIVLDPVTASGPYYLSGGLAGGATVTPEAISAWKRGTYNKRFVTTLMRARALNFATVLIGTPYGFGCKNPFEPPTETCKKKNKNEGLYGIDCSGLVQFAYHLAGFPYFTGRNAEGQYKVAGQFGCYLSGDRVNPGDLVFFDRTYDNKEPTQPDGEPPGAEDILTHVGIATRKDLWIAAQRSKGVFLYTFNPLMTKEQVHGYASVFSDTCN